jgi:transposase
LQHRAEAEQFYRSLSGPVRVGMEACGHYPWFERLLEEMGFELWMGDAAAVRSSVVRKQKTDRRDAEQLLRLLLEDRFPKIWVPSLEVRDVRQLLVHRHKQVQTRTRTKNQLQAMALSQGVQKKRKLWTQAGSRRRQGGGGQKVGHAVVPDVARAVDVCATVSGGHAGEPESFCGRATETERLSGQPASLKAGEFAVRIMGASPEEMDGGT